jgi:hypothetical protein
MTRFLVASEFEDGRHYFEGGITIWRFAEGFGFAVKRWSLPTHAMALSTRDAAQAIVTGLNELHAALGDPRTWFVVELTSFDSLRSGPDAHPRGRDAQPAGAAAPAGNSSERDHG